MNWIKQNYDRFLLALFSVVLLACAGLLFSNAHGFATVFDELKHPVARNNNIPRVDQEAVADKQQHLEKPDEWPARMVDSRRLPLFVSVPYIAKTSVNADGTQSQVLIDPLDTVSGQPIHPPIPNAWLLDHKQDLLSPDVLTQDSDGDGFSTIDEYLGHTDPTDKNSHPPYYTKLVMTLLQRIPFRLRFDAKNGDTLQINILDIQDAPTWFGKVGGMITLTKPNFKVIKFVPKTIKDGNITRDVSEVTVENQETHEEIVLPKQQEVDSPTSYAVLNYLWANKKFAVKKNQEFTLVPEDKVKYKTLEINDRNVVILKEDENKKLTINLVTPGATPAVAR